MSAEALLHQGELDACKAQLFAQIKQSPTNMDLRVFLFQLACVEQDWTRALSQLELLRKMSDANLPLVNTYSLLIDSEQKRQAVLNTDTPSPCFGARPAWMYRFSQVLQYCQQQQFEQARTEAIAGVDAAPEVTGNIDGKPFSWLTDGDMRFGPCFEIMLNGGYFQLPYSDVKRIEFEAVEDLRDVVWRPARLTLKNNAQFIIFMPVRYPITATTTDEQKLAKVCDWSSPCADFYLGQGQRVLISDGTEFALLNIQVIEFD